MANYANLMARGDNPVKGVVFAVRWARVCFSWMTAVACQGTIGISFLDNLEREKIGETNHLPILGADGRGLCHGCSLKTAAYEMKPSRNVIIAEGELTRDRQLMRLTAPGNLTRLLYISESFPWLKR